MTGELYRDFGGSEAVKIKEDAAALRAAARRTSGRAVRYAAKKSDGACAWIGAAGVGMIVFFLCGLACAASRGFGLAIGGEAFLAAAVTVGVKRLIDRLRG